MKKFKVWFVVILLAVGSLMIYWNFYNTYSEGNRSGVLQKFSKKGNIFKTYEGELIMSSIASTSNTTIASEKFAFSVKDENIAKLMFNMEGKHVVVHYQQKRSSLPWGGETGYFVDEVRSKE